MSEGAKHAEHLLPVNEHTMDTHGLTLWSSKGDATLICPSTSQTAQ
jgi:hypothetical protein